LLVKGIRKQFAVLLAADCRLFGGVYYEIKIFSDGLIDTDNIPIRLSAHARGESGRSKGRRKAGGNNKLLPGGNSANG